MSVTKSFYLDNELLRLFALDNQDKTHQDIITRLSLLDYPTYSSSMKMTYIYIHYLASAFVSYYDSNTKEINENEFLNLISSKRINCFDYSTYLAVDKRNLTSVQSNEIGMKIVLNSDHNEYDTLQGEGISVLLGFIENASLSKGNYDLNARVHFAYCYLHSLQKDNDIPNIVNYNKAIIKEYIIDWNQRPFNQKTYEKYVIVFTNEKEYENIPRYIKELRGSLLRAQRLNDYNSIEMIERFLIQLLGYNQKEIRNEATVLLNVLYDETSWEYESPFESTVLSDQDEMIIDINITPDTESFSLYFIGFHYPNILEENKDYHTTYQSPTALSPNKDNSLHLSFNLGKFNKAGYYDWKLFHYSKDIIGPALDPKSKEIKGRFILLPQDTKDISLHEIFCDLLNAEIDKEHNEITKRGTFDSLSEQIPQLNQRGINGIYIMGALERDNGILYDDTTGEVIDIENTDASPMAVTSRCHVSSLLGGKEAFNSLITKANEYDIKIFLDSLSRVSSSRYHRKYKDMLLKYRDDKGKIQLSYGSEGNSINYDDSAILNYRKKETWDLLIEDTVFLGKEYSLSGVHLDNCQSWPQIMTVDLEEMHRVECDGLPRYSPLEILNGEIIIRCEECGYWNSDAENAYANPLLMKLTKEVWKQLPSFIFIGECWNNDKCINRHGSLIKSGIVPRMYSIPKLVSQLYGKRITHNGTIETIPPQSVNIIKELFDTNSKLLPKGSVIIHSSSGQIWPYPAFLFGKGNWSLIDALFTLPEIPMTFMNEINGEAYRVQICNVYESKAYINDSSSNIGNGSQGNRRIAQSKSSIKLSSDSSSTKAKVPSRTFSAERLSSSTKVSSYVQLSTVPIEEAKNLQQKQQTIINEIGRGNTGFDLTKIHLHYDSRRKLRRDHIAFRHGKMILIDNDSNVVLSFARIQNDEIAILSINFSSSHQEVLLDLTGLKKHFGAYGINSICYMNDWISKQNGINCFLWEILTNNHKINIKPFDSAIFGFSIGKDSKSTSQGEEIDYHNVFSSSFSLMCKEIKEHNYSNIGNYEVSTQLKYLIDNQLPLTEFAKWLNSLHYSLSKYNIQYTDYFKHLNFINMQDYSTEYYKYVKRLASVPTNAFGSYRKLPLYAEQIMKQNTYGPICFITPELGRWSTVGGLGVMVDELTTCLAELGQEVYIISPYYHKNRKGEVDYLQKDPAGFIYLNNFTVNLDKQYVFEIYFGKVNGVNLYFMHNLEIFPSPYAEGNIEFTLRQISLMGKASLELLCNINVIPTLIVTNDWFAGLTVGYGKGGHFGDAFKRTLFFHICHNLESAYEGRLYLTYETVSDLYHHIHQLDNNWLVDPYWKEKVINPSRCALLMSDQWGTVSKSYLIDLINQSPLSPLLKSHAKPFGFPNGIFKAKRLQNLQEAFGTDRFKAKETIQMKYFKLPKGDDSIPVYSFIGRITPQKGVLLILECCEEVIEFFDKKINILIGGMANMKDPYCIDCVKKINYLLEKYPKNFWANPNEFFTDGSLVNFGSDFGLMPSVFEPGGIVQHEFFIASTPVIAYCTGGLKDSVFEYNAKSREGNGIVFNVHSYNEFVNALKRSKKLYYSKEHFAKCRSNAYESAIDVMDVARAWGREFYRLKDKTFFNAKAVNEANRLLSKEEIEEFTKRLSDYDEGYYEFNNDEGKLKHKNDEDLMVNITFTYNSEKNEKFDNVKICGSWDNWGTKKDLSYDPLNDRWIISLRLDKGEYLYKYIINNVWKVNQNENKKLENSNTNNYVIV